MIHVIVRGYRRYVMVHACMRPIQRIAENVCNCINIHMYACINHYCSAEAVAVAECNCLISGNRYDVQKCSHLFP